MMEPQLASSVLMIRPVRFESNPQTAESNRFQGKSESTPDEQNRAALVEFDALADSLRHLLDSLRQNADLTGSSNGRLWGRPVAVIVLAGDGVGADREVVEGPS